MPGTPTPLRRHAAPCAYRGPASLSVPAGNDIAMTNTAIALDPTTDSAPALEIHLAEVCRTLPAPSDLSSLVGAVQKILPRLEIRHAMTRGGWHRLGGVVDIDGLRIARNIAEWAESESGGDVDALLFKVADLRYFATGLNGQTHYLVAPTGPGTRDFIQIEIEQVQEVLDRCLTDPDWFPDSIAEFVDPLDFPRLEPEPVDGPRLLFRRLVRVPDLMGSGDAGPHLRRFLDDWGRSSASETAHFCEHWVFAIREYQSRDGEGHLTAKPIPAVLTEVPGLPSAEVARGAQLANQIHGFDRALGYHFAWYFHMLTNPKVSHRLAEAVHADQMGAYDYLPARDLKILRDWYADPYGL